MQVPRLIEYLKYGSELDVESARLIEHAQKFVLNPGTVPQEIRDGASAYTRQLMAAKIFPMPFDICLFEFGPTGIIEQPQGPGLVFTPENDWLWILAWREKIEERTAGWAVYFRAFIQTGKDGSPASLAGVGRFFTDDFDDSGERSYFDLIGVDEEYERIRQQHRIAPGVSALPMDHVVFNNFVHNMMERAFANLLGVLGLMSTSAGVSMETVRPKKKFINALRAKKGKTLLEYEHRTICIDPALTRMPGMVSAGGSHASPRLHWRRGHIRTLVAGRKVEVKPCIVGDVSKGTIVHDYLLRPTNPDGEPPPNPDGESPP